MIAQNTATSIKVFGGLSICGIFQVWGRSRDAASAALFKLTHYPRLKNIHAAGQ